LADAGRGRHTAFLLLAIFPYLEEFTRGSRAAQRGEMRGTAE
jgi:hypothetical protein